MRHQSLLAVLSLLSVVSFGSFGCSSSSSDSSPPAGPTADQACTDIAAAYCDKVSACAPVYVQLGYGDLAACKAAFKPNCLSGLSAPSTGSTPQLVSDCSKAAPSIACADLFSNRVPTACQPVAGKLADGAACGDDSQCTSKYCSTSDTAICGKCGAAPAAGASCATQKCGPGLVCASSTCVVPAKTGETCNDKVPCELGLSCTDGKCGAPASNVGDDCSLDGKGKPLCDFINKALFCLAAKCVQAKLHNVGETCGYDTTTMEVSGCAAEGFCKKDKPTDPAGKCIAAAKVGEKCDATAGPNCDLSLKCVAGTCTKQDPASCK
jgi:hypothetical protein